MTQLCFKGKIADFEELDDTIDVTAKRNDKESKRIFTRPFELVPNYFTAPINNISKLEWKYVKYYRREEIKKVPAKAGIYAFVARHDNDIFPHHGYVMYVGVSGLKGRKSLNKRYKEYVSHSGVKKATPDIREMLSAWRNMLYFYYSETEDKLTAEQLFHLETELIQALLPPINQDKKNRRKQYKFPGVSAEGKKAESIY